MTINIYEKVKCHLSEVKCRPHSRNLGEKLMKKAIEIIKEAEKKGVALGHFNISDLAGLNGIVRAARDLNIPVFIGVSEGERESIGVKTAVALIKSLRVEFNHPIFLNADHTYSLEKIKEVVKAGYDSVIFDGAKLPFEENIKKTEEVVEYVKSKNTEILVEAELGYIGQSSKLLDKVPEGAGLRMTTPDEAAQFVKETKIDMLAPSVGNIHGMLKNVPEPRLDAELIGRIKKAVKIPLVLHGASGNTEEDLQAAIKAGINMIHINTEIRVGWKKGMESALKNNPDETTPYKLLAGAEAEVYKIVLGKLKIFNNLI